MTKATFLSQRIQRMTSEPARSTPLSNDLVNPVRSLHLNEAPFPPAAGVIQAMSLAAASLNRYPDHQGHALCEALTESTGVSVDRIVIGAGSNELLYTSAAIMLDPETEVVAPAPGFPAYAKSAALAGARFVGVPLLPDGRVDVDGILAGISPQTRLVFVSSPHNPTGGMLSQERIEHLIKHTPEHVLLHFDEAYYEFGRHAGGPETLPLLEQRKAPWICTRSFSKAYGLAGARIGYGIASDAGLAGVYKTTRTNFSVNAVALAGAIAALKEKEHLAQLLDHTARERSRLAAALASLGFTPLPSAANFLTVVAPKPAQELALALRARNIFVLAMAWPGEMGALRISIGSTEDMSAVIDGLATALQ